MPLVLTFTSVTLLTWDLIERSAASSEKLGSSRLMKEKKQRSYYLSWCSSAGSLIQSSCPQFADDQLKIALKLNIVNIVIIINNPDDDIIRVIFSDLSELLQRFSRLSAVFFHTLNSVPWLIYQLDTWKQWCAPLRPQTLCGEIQSFSSFYCAIVTALVHKCSHLLFYFSYWGSHLKLKPNPIHSTFPPSGVWNNKKDRNYVVNYF